MTIDIPQDKLVAGVDEVGRGPLVGDVVTAAVILDPANPILGLADSKKLSEKKRLALYGEIKAKALAWSIGRATPDEIDQLNILHATMLAMQRAVVKGDSLVAAISAASILAKVTRDAEMTELDSRHPEYGFARHKGYPTAEHLAILAERGPLPEYRQSFKPVRRALGIE